MKLLSELLDTIDVFEVVGDTAIAIESIEIDSRRVTPNSAFIAIRGSSMDGHQFIEKAVDNGARVIFCEALPASIRGNVTYVHVASSASTAGKMASKLLDNPSWDMKVVGVTGTNGKTTTVTLLYDLFAAMGYKVGLISTVEIRIAGIVELATHTTPDPINLQRLLNRMRESGCSYVFMEVSSHAVDQDRIAGIRFAGGVFTNMSHDHLDYHKTFDAYITAKKRFFDQLEDQAFALINLDDKRGRVMIQNCSAQKRTYSYKTLADFKGKLLASNIEGLHLLIDGIECHARMLGDYNAYNFLAAYGTAVLLGGDRHEVLTYLSALKGAEGRFEYLIHPLRKIIGIIDYAHTPDALSKVIATCKGLLMNNKRLIVVMGCGGDRDRTKRPVMGNIAASLADQAVFTSDNPRTEPPAEILKEIEAGVHPSDRQKYLVIEDRAMAIKTAYQIAQDGDIILIAGKGHEKYQEINGVKHPFDDVAYLKEIFEPRFT